MKKTAIFPLIVKSLNVLLYILAIACSGFADTETNTPTITPTCTITPTYNIAVSSVWRVNTGGPAFVDSWGNTWMADTNYSGGYGHGVTVTVSNTNDSALYQDERFGNPFTYTFNVPPGNYQVTLKFAELYWEEAGDRIFDVYINSTRVLDDFDIYDEAAVSFRAVSKVFDNISAAAGRISIEFGSAVIDNAQVSALQINPMPTATPPLLTATAGCAHGITVNGIMDESSWASAQEYQVAELCLGTNPNNVSGSFKTLWDTENFYVGLDVNDLYLNAPQEGCDNYNDSAIEIYFDMGNHRGSETYPNFKDDFHFMISYDCKEFCLNAQVPLLLDGLEYKSTYDANGYIMEVMIPWSVLGVVPQNGSNYQFDVQIDFNDGTAQRVGQLVWNGDEDNWESSANLGDIVLGFCPPTPTPIPPALEESFHVYPNPVNPKIAPASISYYISNDSEVTIKIFTITGKPVKTILDKALKIKAGNGHTEDIWDGKNEKGQDVLSGVYLCALEVKDKSTGKTTKLVKKMAVLR